MLQKKLKKTELDEINALLLSEDDIEEEFFEKKPKKKRIKSKENYVNPEIFESQILQYYKDGIITNDLGKSINDIAHRMGFMPNFINYTYKEEMIGDALEKMFKALINKKFNPSKGNPFSYYTKIAFNAFCNRIKKEKRNREAVLGYQTEVYETLTITGNLTEEIQEENIVEEELYDN